MRALSAGLAIVLALGLSGCELVDQFDNLVVPDAAGGAADGALPSKGDAQIESDAGTEGLDAGAVLDASELELDASANPEDASAATGLDASAATGLDASAAVGLDASAILPGLDASAVAGLDASAILPGLDASAVAGLDASAILPGLDAGAAAGLDASAAGLDAGAPGLDASAGLDAGVVVVLCPANVTLFGGETILFQTVPSVGGTLTAADGTIGTGTANAMRYTAPQPTSQLPTTVTFTPTSGAPVTANVLVMPTPASALNGQFADDGTLPELVYLKTSDPGGFAVIETTSTVQSFAMPGYVNCNPSENFAVFTDDRHSSAISDAADRFAEGLAACSGNVWTPVNAPTLPATASSTSAPVLSGAVAVPDQADNGASFFVLYGSVKDIYSLDSCSAYRVGWQKSATSTFTYTMDVPFDAPLGVGRIDASDKNSGDSPAAACVTPASSYPAPVQASQMPLPAAGDPTISFTVNWPSNITTTGQSKVIVVALRGLATGGVPVAMFMKSITPGVMEHGVSDTLQVIADQSDAENTFAVGAILDLNGDGMVGPDDLSTLEDSQPSQFINRKLNNSNVTVNLATPSQINVTVATSNDTDGEGDSSLSLHAIAQPGQLGLASARATCSVGALSTAFDLAFGETSPGMSGNVSIPLSVTSPLSVTLDMRVRGSSCGWLHQSLQAPILTKPPTITALPTINAATKITWQPPTGWTPDYYEFTLASDSTGTTDWTTEVIPSSSGTISAVPDTKLTGGPHHWVLSAYQGQNRISVSGTTTVCDTSCASPPGNACSSTCPGICGACATGTCGGGASPTTCGPNWVAVSAPGNLTNAHIAAATLGSFESAAMIVGSDSSGNVATQCKSDKTCSDYASTALQTYPKVTALAADAGAGVFWAVTTQTQDASHKAYVLHSNADTDSTDSPQWTLVDTIQAPLINVAAAQGVAVVSSQNASWYCTTSPATCFSLTTPSTDLLSVGAVVGLQEAWVAAQTTGLPSEIQLLDCPLQSGANCAAPIALGDDSAPVSFVVEQQNAAMLASNKWVWVSTGDPSLAATAFDSYTPQDPAGNVLQIAAAWGKNFARSDFTVFTDGWEPNTDPSCGVGVGCPQILTGRGNGGSFVKLTPEFTYKAPVADSAHISQIVGDTNGFVWAVTSDGTTLLRY